MIATDSRRTRRAALAAAALLTVPTLAACGQAATDAVYTPAVGVNDRDGDVDVLNALVVSDGKDGGRLVAGLVNNDREEADELVDVSVAEGEATVSPGEGETEIPAGGILQLADDEAAVITMSGIEVGSFVRVTFSFQNADDATLNVPVVQPDADYADVDVEGQVTPSETAAVGQDPHGEGEE